MRCSRVQFLYEDYTAGTLPAETASRVDQHMAACRDCRDFFEESDEISQLISSTSEVVHPGDAYLDDLTSRVMESLYDETGEFRAIAPARVRVLDLTAAAARRPLFWAGAVAALLLLAPMLASLSGSGAGSLSNSPAISSPASNANQGTALAKSVRSLPDTNGRRASDAEISIVASALPLGQGLLYNGIRPVSLHASRPATRAAGQSHDVAPAVEIGTLEELIALEAVGTPEARQRIYALLRTLGESLSRQYPASGASGELVLMQQTHLYHRAEDAARNGRLAEAIDAYSRILEVNPSTILGRRSSMRLADLYFYEVGDFARAREYYALSEGQTAKLALTADEIRHIDRRLRLIDSQADHGFDSLTLVHRLGKAPWTEVVAPFAALLSSTRSAELWGEAAATLMDRLRSESLPADDVAFELVDLIESHLPSCENADAKAWLYLLLGDMIWIKFESSEPALEAYRSAQKLDDRSESSAIARERIDLLRRDQVVVFGR